MNRETLSRPSIAVAAVSMCLVAALTGLAACSSSRETGSEPDTTATAELRPEQRFYDYRLIETEAGVRQWVLNSDQMLKYSGQRDVLLVVVEMDFFRNGEHFSVLTADSGRANLQSKDVHVWGDVLVVTDDGRRLETSELTFDNESGKIRNEVFNRFTRQGDVLTGIGLEATPDLEYIEIKQKVEAEVVDTPVTEDGAR